MKKIITPIFLLVLLTGCVEWAAKGIEDANYLHITGRNFIIENHTNRQGIRKMCWDNMMEIKSCLARQSRHTDISQLLMDNYPNLVTFEYLDKVLENPGLPDVIVPPGCRETMITCSNGLPETFPTVIAQ